MIFHRDDPGTLSSRRDDANTSWRGSMEGKRGISVYPSFLAGFAPCLRVHESAYLRAPVVQMRSRLVQPGCDVRRPLPSRVPSDGRRVNCLLSHWHTGQIPASTRPPVTRIHTRTHAYTHTPHAQRTHSRSAPPPPPPPPPLPLRVLFLLRTLATAAAAVACSSK